MTKPKKTIRLQLYMVEEDIVEELQRMKTAFEKRNSIKVSWSQFTRSIITEVVKRRKEHGFIS